MCEYMKHIYIERYNFIVNFPCNSKGCYVFYKTVCFFSGKNCTYATENSMPLPLVQPPFSCELNFLSSSADISANDLFYSSSGFDIEKGMFSIIYKYIIEYYIYYIL